MGMSANAAVGFGVLLEEYTDLPWNGDEFDGDYEAWWRAECGWSEKWQRDFTDAENDDYFRRRRAFDAENPLPVVVERRGWGDYTEPVLFLLGTAQGCEYEGDLDPSPFATSPDPEPVLKFCEKYGIEIGDQKPRWLLIAEVS